MKQIFNIFKIKTEEKWIALSILALLSLLNGVVIAKYATPFTAIGGNYYQTFIRHFCISGFDPLTYWVLSDWSAAYNVYRHPLLAIFMYIPYLINMGLMQLTGYNCALFIAIAIQMFCGFYALIFLYRILREVIELTPKTSYLLTFLFFSFGFVMLTCIVPDHFVISMMLLILALYISGKNIKQHRTFKIWQSILLFILTAGTSLNNGLKIFFSLLFTNGKRFFRPKHLLLAVILPASLLWIFGQWEYKHLVWPKEMARKEAKAKEKETQKEKLQRIATLKALKDSLTKDSVRRGLKTITPQEIAQKAKDDSLRHTKDVAKKKRSKKKEKKQGAPLTKVGFLSWTDISTSRSQTIVENLFGEGIQLHEDHLLQDELRHRPMFVNYRHWWNYAIEAIIGLLFLAGIWCGRKSKFLWLAMSYFALDMLLHIGLGFGLNEVYIMSAHWIYVLPIAMAYLYKATAARYQKALTATIGVLTAYLLLYNGGLIISYFCA